MACDETGSRVRKAKRFTGAQTAAAVWTPATGKCIVFEHIYFITDAAADIKLFIGTDTEANDLAGGAFAANSGMTDFVPREKFAADAVIKITTSAGNCRVILRGCEEAP